VTVAQFNTTNHELSIVAQDIAKRLDDAQRATNYLAGLVESWDDYNDQGKLEEVMVALDRLTRSAT